MAKHRRRLTTLTTIKAHDARLMVLLLLLHGESPLADCASTIVIDWSKVNTIVFVGGEMLAPPLEWRTQGKGIMFDLLLFAFQRYDDQADSRFRGVGPTFAGLVFMVMAWALGAENGWWHKRTAGRPWLRTFLLLGPPAAVLWFFSGVAHAGNVYVCKGKHGETVFQGVPCAKDTKPLKHLTYDNALGRPGAPEPEYERRSTPVTYAGASAFRGTQGTAPAVTPTPYQGNYGGGLGSSAYQRGQVRGTRCESATGRVYYTAGACGSTTQAVGSHTVTRNWQNDTVQGAPAAVMTAPDQAFDPRTGQYIQLQHADSMHTVDVYRTTRDQGTSMDADSACVGAQRYADQHLNSSAAQHQVEALCRQGRSLYDTKPSNRSLYSGG